MKLKRFKPHTKAMFRQPEGYYDQVLTDARHMTPRQRWIHAMGGTVIHGRYLPIWEK